MPLMDFSTARRLRAAAVTTIFVATLLAPLEADAADDTDFTFLGGGWGHSVGLSQYGAYGMSKAGFGYQDIVTQFYSESVVTDLATDLADAPLWVNVATSTGKGSVSLAVVSVGPNPVPVVFSSDFGSFEATVGQTVVVEALGGGQCTVSGPDGSITGPCEVDADWDGSEASPNTALRIVGCSTCTYARGALRVRPHEKPGRFNLSLEIAVEHYMLGIAEMPYSWGNAANGGMAALEAQAVAARSYAVRTALDRGAPQNRLSCWCQLSVTTADQVYVGYGFGHQTWIDAVNATAGRIVSHPSQPAGRPIKAFYSSSSYGATESYRDGFGGTTDVPWLQPVDDYWSADPALNPNARWTAVFTGAELAAALSNRPGIPDLGTVDAVSVTRCSTSGAALELTFVGPGGSAAVSTRLLRGYLGLLSMQVYNVGAPPPASSPCVNLVGSVNGPTCDGIAYDPGDPTHVIYPGSFPTSADGTVRVDLRGADGPRVVFWDGAYDGSTRIRGTPYGDVICGAENASGESDWIHGYGGNDVILAGEGSDTVKGGAGADEISGGSGADDLRGGSGNDTIDGGPEGDSIKGGSGDDMLIAGSGSDMLRGGAGDDRLEAIAGDANRLLGGAGKDTILGGSGDDDLLRGGRDRDDITGGSGDGHVLKGNKGHDRLTGGSGDQHRLLGGPGDDVLVAGTGSGHVLNGGTGNNTLNP